MFFLVLWKYVEDKDLISRTASAHKAYLQEQVALGRVRVAGPSDDGSGGVLIVEVRDQSELRVLLDQDPYVSEGVVAESRVHAFDPVLGALADRPPR